MAPTGVCTKSETDVEHYAVEVRPRWRCGLVGVDFGVVVEDLTPRAQTVARVDLGIGTGPARSADAAPTGGAGAFEDVVGQVITAGNHPPPPTDADCLLTIAQANGVGTALGAGEVDGLAGDGAERADDRGATEADVRR